MNKIWIVLIAVLTGAILFGGLGTPRDEFVLWKLKFTPDYTPEEEVYRKEVFLRNLEEINHHNGLLGSSYKLGVNEFTVLTKEEFAQKHLSAFPSKSLTSADSEDNIVGVDVDWVAYGAVSSVKRQGDCAASYAFSAVGALEGAYCIWNRFSVEFSVQQVIDCSSGYNNYWCISGRMDNTFNYTRDRGINTWASYPFVGYNQTCKYPTGIWRNGGYADAVGCSALQNALINLPVSVAMDGNNFQNYYNGVFNNCSTNLSVAGLLVGMTDNYWRVKMSWGTAWGEAGFIRLSRGNTCGICNAASYPTR